MLPLVAPQHVQVTLVVQQLAPFSPFPHVLQFYCSAQVLLGVQTEEPVRDLFLISPSCQEHFSPDLYGHPVVEARHSDVRVDLEGAYILGEHQHLHGTTYFLVLANSSEEQHLVFFYLQTHLEVPDD